MHTIEELIGLKKALNAELDKVIEASEKLDTTVSQQQFKDNGTALMRALASGGVLADVLAVYADEWAQNLAAEIVLDSDQFDAVLAAMEAQDTPKGKN